MLSFRRPEEGEIHRAQGILSGDFSVPRKLSGSFEMTEEIKMTEPK